MGGYAAFVWPSYAVAAAVMGAIAVAAVRRARARSAELEALQARLGRRRERSE
jgi:heme exporter protein D